jgi:N-acetyl sugar amidotransferase
LQYYLAVSECLDTAAKPTSKIVNKNKPLELANVQCSKCLMDSHDDPKIRFDDQGVCEYCLGFEEEKRNYVREGAEGEQLMTSTIEKIKAYGAGRKYDALVGLSGGIDSSYVAYLAKLKGLRVLCVHFDNGWNSELAVANIQAITTKLGFDLYTYVINWEEFKDLQLSYLKASVIDIEVITDHAIYGVLYKVAQEKDIKYVLGGHNVVTEGVLPFHWLYNSKDDINIKSIHRKYGTQKLKTYPFLDARMRRFILRSGVEFINYLNWVPYKKDAAKKELADKLGWRDYGEKHHESIWTKFYQAYILPVKFGVDKRKAHFSTLICSGQMTKYEALEEITRPSYSEAELKNDKLFILKKLGLSEDEFEGLMHRPIQSHWDFDTQGSFFNHYPIFKPLRPLWLRLRLPNRTKNGGRPFYMLNYSTIILVLAVSCYEIQCI